MPTATSPTSRAAITDTVVGMLHAIDARDWSAVRTAFADTVTTDYTSLFGGEVETQSADALVEGWADFLPGFDATQHLAGPLVVEEHSGDTARVRCAVTATHRLDESLWTVGGHYNVRLTRRDEDWCITHLTLEAAFEEGSRTLIDRAADARQLAP